MCLFGAEVQRDQEGQRNLQQTMTGLEWLLIQVSGNASFKWPWYELKINLILLTISGPLVQD